MLRERPGVGKEFWIGLGNALWMSAVLWVLIYGLIDYFFL